MQLNIKNPKPELFMYEKKSNRGTALVAFIAIVLILGGVYLLNQSFSKPQEDTNNSSPSQQASNSSTSNSTSQNENEAKEEPSTSTDTNSSISSNTSNSNTSTNSSTPPTSDDPDSSTSNSNNADTQVETPPNTENTNNLEDNQVILKVLSKDNNTYQTEIVTSGVPEATLLKSGGKVRINISGITLEEGKTYQITGLTESNGKISISIPRDGVKEVTI